jgi:hypothetical protein
VPLPPYTVLVPLLLTNVGFRVCMTPCNSSVTSTDCNWLFQSRPSPDVISDDHSLNQESLIALLPSPSEAAQTSACSAGAEAGTEQFDFS